MFGGYRRVPKYVANATSCGFYSIENIIRQCILCTIDKGHPLCYFDVSLKYTSDPVGIGRLDLKECGTSVHPYQSIRLHPDRDCKGTRGVNEWVGS